MADNKTDKTTTSEKAAPETKAAFSVSGREIKNLGGRPPKYSTPEELQAKIDEYFESCWVDKITESTDEKTGKIETSAVHYQQRPYTISGLAYHLEMSTEALRNYQEKDGFLAIVKRAKQKVEMDIEEQLIGGKNAAGPIFWLKNHAGYRDKQDIEHSGAVEYRKVERAIVDPKSDTEN